MESDWLRLKSYSEKKNKGKANALYSSNNGYIDPGFLENKTIKHAFDAYPKKPRIGKFTTLQTDQEEAPVVDYGFVYEDQVNEPQQASPESFDESQQIEAP